MIDAFDMGTCGLHGHTPNARPPQGGLYASAIALIVLAAALGTAGCRGEDPATDASAATPSETRDWRKDAGLHLDASQIKQVSTEALSTHGPATTIKATGTVAFNADRTAKLIPPVSGQVQDIAVNAGDTVRKNAVLFVLSSREVAAAFADHLASHKDLELADKTYAMTKDLFEHEAASRIALEQSESELAKARSKVLQSEEGLQVLGFDLKAEDDATRVQPRIPV